MTTLTQLRRIDKVRRVLENAIADGTASEYNHNNYGTCTIGFAIKSQQFKGFPAKLVGDSVVPNDPHTSMRALIVKFFGQDYNDDVASGFSGVNVSRAGVPQAKRALLHINTLIRNHPQAYLLGNTGATIAVVATDTTHGKIAVRVKSLTTSIELADKLLREDAGATLVNIDALKSARDELNILQQYV